METTALRINETDLVSMYKEPQFWRGMLNRDLNNFDIYEKISWMQSNWHVSIYASAIYLILIFGTKEFMKSRKPFELKGLLILWNFALAVFSIKALSVCFPELMRVIEKNGIHESVCGSISLMSKESTYWGTLFVYSKIFELGDTAFIVLRKRKLLFLHWYHHISVLICVWVSSKDVMSTGAWFGLVNLFVHSLMYTYFTLTSLGIKVPKFISMIITACQLSQMFVGLGVNFYAIHAKLTGQYCTVSNSHIILIFSMYTSYAILFWNYFYQTYIVTGMDQVKRKLQ